MNHAKVAATALEACMALGRPPSSKWFNKDYEILRKFAELLAAEVGIAQYQRGYEEGKAFERESFYGCDKPDECRNGCPPNQICDYCRIIEPVKDRIAKAVAAERAACAKVCEDAISSIWEFHPEYVNQVGRNVCTNLAAAIRARSNT